MQLRSNPLLKYALLGVLVLVVYVGVTLLGKGKPQTPEQPQSAQLTPEQAKALGIEGDTANDTLRTIVVESRQLKEQLNKVLRDNEEAKRENDGLKAQLSNINTTVDSRVQAGINQGLESQQKQTQGLFDGLQKQLNTLSQMGNQVGGNGGSGTDMPIGLGIAPGEGNQFKKGSGSSDLVWIEPQDGTAVDAAGKPIAAGSSQAASGFAFPTAFGAADQKTLDAASGGAQRAADGMGGDEPSRKKVRKVHTLPQNSTLMGSVSMTALVGRVPVDGTVNDPYTEGVVLSKSMETLFRAVPPSLYLALAMTEPEEKAERAQLMEELGTDELEAALAVAARLDRLRGIEPYPFKLPPARGARR